MFIDLPAMPPPRFTLHMSVLIAGAAALLGVVWQMGGKGSAPIAPSPDASEPAKAVSKAPSSSQRPGTVSLTELLGRLDAPRRRADLQTLASELGRVDPTRGWQMLTSIPGMADRETFAQQLLQAWAEHDLQGALAACKSLPAGQLRASSHASVMGIWARSAPANAADWASTQLTGSARQAALSAVARTWAQQDTNAAARWAQAQGDTSAGLAAISEVMAHWANLDPQTGATWSTTLFTTVVE